MKTEQLITQEQAQRLLEAARSLYTEMEAHPDTVIPVTVAGKFLRLKDAITEIQGEA